MEKTLKTINELLLEMDISPINEQTAKQWFIEGGESLNELVEMTNCYAGEIHESDIAEKRDVVTGDYIQHTDKYYPYTAEQKYKHTASLFGKIIYYGYVNGLPKEEYFLS